MGSFLLACGFFAHGLRNSVQEQNFSGDFIKGCAVPAVATVVDRLRRIMKNVMAALIWHSVNEKTGVGVRGAVLLVTMMLLRATAARAGRQGMRFGLFQFQLSTCQPKAGAGAAFKIIRARDPALPLAVLGQAHEHGIVSREMKSRSFQAVQIATTATSRAGRAEFHRHGRVLLGFRRTLQRPRLILVLHGFSCKFGSSSAPFYSELIKSAAFSFPS